MENFEHLFSISMVFNMILAVRLMTDFGIAKFDL